MSTQRERILDLLRERGSRGLHSFELVEMHMPRGADAILRLRQDGYAISSTREALRGNAKGVRYRLVSEPGSAPRTVGSTRQFQQRTDVPSPYEYEDAA